MTTEKEIERLFAELVLDVIKNPANKTNIDTFCREYHIDRRKLTSKKVFSINNRTLFRLMLGLAQLASFKEYFMLCINFAIITFCVANSDDGSPEAILEAHTGSPINRKKNQNKS